MSVPKIEPISIKEYTVKRSKYEVVGKLAVRSVILGPSGSGKTQLLLSMLMKYTNWDKLYLVAPSVDDQHCYQVLKDFNETATENAGYDVVEFITDIVFLVG